LFDILTGQVTTIAGSSKGIQDGFGSNVQMKNPFGVCLNPYDNCLYVSDSGNHKIIKVTLNGIEKSSVLICFEPFFSLQDIHTQTQEE
jgi:hypothetical protein